MSEERADNPVGDRRRAAGRLTAALVLMSLALVVCGMLAITGVMKGRGAHDQLNFHEKVVRTFASQWPRPAFDDYLSATTPGYHVVLAWAVERGVDSTTGLRLVGLTFTLGLLGTLGLWVGWRLDRTMALAVCLPMAVSLYVVQSGAWLLPDNLGWWVALVVVMLALRRKFDAWTLLLGGVLLALLVVCRQIHIWAAAPLWVAAWLSADVEDNPAVFESPDGRVRQTGLELMTNMAVRLFHAFLALLASAPAFAFLLLFHGLWGGLVPPTFQEMYRGETAAASPVLASPAAPAFFLSIFGVVSVFFAGFLVQPMLVILRKWSILVPIAAAVGVILALLPETTYSEPNRTSGIWNAVKAMPVLWGRTSLVMLVLAPLGAVALVTWAWALSHRSRWIVLSAVAGFVAAQCVSAQLWQRYTEPFVLMLVALMAAEVGIGRGARLARIIGPVALAVILASVTTVKLATGPEATDRGRKTLREQTQSPRERIEPTPIAPELSPPPEDSLPEESPPEALNDPPPPGL